MSAPKVSTLIATCGGCESWQIDVPQRAVSELGGQQAALVAIAEINSQHSHSDCPNGPSTRMLVQGKWVDTPKMQSGGQANGALVLQPFPRWWVDKR